MATTMGDGVKAILAKPIQLANKVIRSADYAVAFPLEFADLKAKTERLAALLRQAARAKLFPNLTRRIMDDITQILDGILLLISKCTGIIKRVFIIKRVDAFRKLSTLLDTSLDDVFWLLRVPAYADDDDGTHHLDLMSTVATLINGSLDARADAAASLCSFARDNERHGKFFMDNCVVVHIIYLMREGTVPEAEVQEAAVRALGLLACYPESVKKMVQAGICSAFAKMLKEAPMSLQIMVAWSTSELAAHYPLCQDAFARSNIIRLLIGHLVFETVQEHSNYTVNHYPPEVTSNLTINYYPPETVHEHSKYTVNYHPSKVTSNLTVNFYSPKFTSIHTVNYTIPPKVTSIDIVDMANNSPSPNPTPIESSDHPHSKHPLGSHNQPAGMHSVMQNTLAKSSKAAAAAAASSSGTGLANQQQTHIAISGASIKGRGFEDASTKAYMKAMTARALSQLAKGNPAICKIITESRALLCFAVLLEKGTEDVQYNSALALMEIARVTEQDADLRRSAFKPNSPAARAVVDQLIRIVEKADYDDLLVPCIVSLGCLSRTFRATETRIVGSLVRLLNEGERNAVILREAVVALGKFACTENYLHLDHCKAIIDAGGAKHLVQIVRCRESTVQIPTLVLLCYIAYHIPDSEALAQAEVLTVLEWASKQAHMVQDPTVDTLLPETKVRLELYQLRGSRGCH